MESVNVLPDPPILPEAGTFNTHVSRAKAVIASSFVGTFVASDAQLIPNHLPSCHPQGPAFGSDGPRERSALRLLQLYHEQGGPCTSAHHLVAVMERATSEDIGHLKKRLGKRPQPDFTLPSWEDDASPLRLIAGQSRLEAFRRYEPDQASRTWPVDVYESDVATDYASFFTLTVHANEATYVCPDCDGDIFLAYSRAVHGHADDDASTDQQDRNQRAATSQILGTKSSLD